MALSVPLVVVGSRLIVRYHGMQEYHERLVTGLTKNGNYVVLTPDEDHYVESPSDYAECHLAGTRGGLPSVIRKKEDRFYIHRFEFSYEKEELARIFEEGRRLVRESDQLDGAGQAAAVLGLNGHVRVPRKGPADTLAPRAGRDGPVAGSSGSRDDEIWIATDFVGTVKVGDDLGRGPPLFAHGQDGLFTVGVEVVRGLKIKIVEAPGWVAARLEFLRGKLRIEAVPAEFLDDARTLKVKYDSRGERGRSFTDGVSEMDPQVFEDWPFDPPRTSLYYSKEIAKLGYGPVARHEKWVCDNKLTPDDAGVGEHEVAAEVLETLVAYDQLDISNLAGVERLLRRQQFIEEGYRQKVEAKRLEKATDLTASMAEHFTGKPRMAGGAIVSPALLRHAAERAAQDNDILKQQRKAAETRGLLKNGNKK
jgi:hypothetical protein